MKNYSLTALCLCTLIGAGFATGRELITYFIRYGIYGFFAIGAASVMFSIAIYLALTSPCKSISELIQRRFPYPIAFAADKTVFLFLIVIYSGMIAASGEVFSLLFGIDKTVCAIISVLLCLIVMITGNSALTEISKILFIPMAVIIFVISGKTAGTNITIPPDNSLGFNTLASPVIYLSYNMITAIALLLSLPKAEKPKAVAIQTGFLIFILATFLALPLYTHYNDVFEEQLPVMALLEDYGFIKYLYILFLLFAIFTTAVSNGCSAMHFLTKKISRTASAVIITSVAYALSLAGFSEIVDKVYFVFGMAGMILLFGL